MNNIKFIILLFFILPSSTAFSLENEPLPLILKKDFYRLGKHLEYIEDKNDSLSFKDVSSPKFSKNFIKSRWRIPNFGYTRSAYWVRFTVTCPEEYKKIPQKWLFQMRRPLIHTMNVYIPDEAGYYKKHLSGESQPFSSRHIKSRLYMFPLNLKPGKEKTVYIYFKDIGATIIPLSVTTRSKLTLDVQKDYILLGLLYGIRIILLLYNFLLFLSVRDKNYLFYALFITAVTFYYLMLDGLSNQYIWRDFTPVMAYFRTFWPVLSITMGIIFSRNFLNVKNDFPRINRFFNFYIGVLILLAGISFFIPQVYSLPAALLLAMVQFILFILLAVRQYQNGYQGAQFYILAFSTVIAGVGVFLLNRMNLLPVNTFTEYAQQIFMIFQITILNYAVGDRIRRTEQDRYIAQNQAVKNLKRFDKLKNEFLANTSHELRTPLHGIVGLSESMIQEAKGKLPPETISNLSLIAGSGRRLSNLVNDILDFSRMRKNEMELNLKSVDLWSIAEIIILLTSSLIKEKPVVIRNSIDKSLPMVRGDEDRIRQILHNLIGNAIKFTHRGSIEISGKVIPEIKQSPPGDKKPCQMVVISIKDTGIGIPPDMQKIIFHSFQQGEEDINHLFGGTGLGLAITRKLVELQGGTIEINSRVGEGSEFIFSLPAAEEVLTMKSTAHHLEADDIEKTKKTTLQESGEPEDFYCDEKIEGNPEILIVDDDTVNIQVLRNYLKTHECSLRTTGSGIEALEILSQETFDLVLLDVMMPVLSGYETCRRIRETHSAEKLPVIMLTAKTSAADINEGFKSGANDYITKPFHAGELIRRINVILRGGAASRPEEPLFSINDRGTRYSIPCSSIFFLSSQGKYTIMHTRDGDYEFARILKNIEENLPRDIFIRIHRQYIVNTTHIERLRYYEGGRYNLYLRDDEASCLPVGKTYTKTIKEILEKN